MLSLGWALKRQHEMRQAWPLATSEVIAIATIKKIWRFHSFLLTEGEGAQDPSSMDYPKADKVDLLSCKAFIVSQALLDSTRNQITRR